MQTKKTYINRDFGNTTWWIYLLAFVALLPALFLRDYTPSNELRYLSIADEALRDGSIWCFNNHDIPYADKPPLYLWIVMAGRVLLGGHYMWFIGLFSLIPMLITGYVMDRWSRPFFTIRQRQAALLMLFTCGYFPGAAVTLRMDMLMTMWIVLALYAVYKMTDGNSLKLQVLLGVFTFMALFTKGPLGVLIPLGGTACYLAATGRIRSFFRYWGIWPWLILIVASALWFTAVYLEGGKEYLDNLLFHQTVDRAVDAFHHKRPFWYYLVCIWYVMAPWSVVIAYILVKKRREALKGDYRKMMAAVSIFTIVILSCISSKLQIYLLPIVPLVVYCGVSLENGEKWNKVVGRISTGLLVAIFILSFALPYVNDRFGYRGVAERAEALDPSKVYVDRSVYRGENIDVYFDVPVEVVSLDSIAPEPSSVGIAYEKETKEYVIKKY